MAYDYFSAQDVADLDSMTGSGDASLVSATDPMLTGSGVAGETWKMPNQDWTWATQGLQAMMKGMGHMSPVARGGNAGNAGNMGNGQMNNDVFNDITKMAQGTNPLSQLTSFKNLF